MCLLYNFLIRQGEDSVRNDILFWKKEIDLKTVPLVYQKSRRSSYNGSIGKENHIKLIKIVDYALIGIILLDPLTSKGVEFADKFVDRRDRKRFNPRHILSVTRHLNDNIAEVVVIDFNARNSEV